MIVVAADGLRPREVGHVDDAEAAVPAARPHLVAEAQRMVQPVAPCPARSASSPPAMCWPGIHQRDTSCGLRGSRRS